MKSLLNADCGNMRYNLVRVDESNIKEWDQFLTFHKTAIQQARQNAEKLKKSLDIRLVKTEECVETCLEALKFYDSAEVYMAYIEDISPSAAKAHWMQKLEMMVTVTTSSDADFSTHMGICRSIFYEGTKHPHISMELQSFAAKAILDLHPSKLDMINVPTKFMYQFFKDEFAKQHKEIYEGIDSERSKVSWWAKHPLLKSPLAQAEALKTSLKDLSEIGGFNNQSLTLLTSGKIDEYFNEHQYQEADKKTLVGNLLDLRLKEQELDGVLGFIANLDVD